MIRLRIAEILSERGITKTQFAEMMGIKKQNVNVLLETSNINKIEEIAERLGVKFSDLIDDGTAEPQLMITGYLEYDGRIVKVDSLYAVKQFINEIENFK